jgi:hypothetical protein
VQNKAGGPTEQVGLVNIRGRFNCQYFCAGQLHFQQDSWYVPLVCYELDVYGHRGGFSSGNCRYCQWLILQNFFHFINQNVLYIWVFLGYEVDTYKSDSQLIYWNTEIVEWMMEYLRAVRMSARQPWKVATEIMSLMKHFKYVEKEKRFWWNNLVTFLQHMML